MSFPSLSIQLITISIISLQRELTHLRLPQNQWSNTYDYIVIGSGSAGSVVASRLSENPSFSVLLLEAGVPDSVFTDIPIIGLPANGFTYVGTEYDWGYTYAPQRRAAQAFNNHQNYQLIGRVLGGSSTINTLFYNRGNRRDFDNWVKTYGAHGWSYDEVLPYFLRSENNTDPKIVKENCGYHSTGGPLTVVTVRNPDPILRILEKVFEKEGIPVIDFNGAKQLGQCLVQENIKLDGVRGSTSNMFLMPNSKRTNLDIVVRAFATKILFNDKKRATAVQFVRNGNNFTVNARKEIIISGGAINSPQLLMLSGIGPKDHLSSFNIPVITDLPVGHNLQDHIKISILLNIFNKSYVNSVPELSVQNLYEFYIKQKGVLGQIPAQLVYLNSKLNENNEWPDILVHFVILTINYDLNSIVRPFKRQNEWRNYWKRHLGQQFLNAGTVLARTKTRGTVRLNSRNPFVSPVIDANYFDNPYDFEALMDGFKQTIKLLTKTSLSEFVTPFAEPIPGCKSCGKQSLYECDEYLKCYIHELSNTYNHPMGSCRMGSANDSKAVVDQRLRVIGVSGLRVIDGSVMPEMINANLNAAIVMIGEYGAQMVKEDQKY